MSIRNDYLSKENTNCMKFVFAIAIVFCHVFAYNPFGMGIGIGAIITAFGYLSVSAFLFFSGYGLMVQYLSRGDKFFEKYFTKRILPIYIIQSLLILLYSLFKLLIGYSFSYRTVLQSFLFGNTIIQYGWYLQMIMLFYAIFYFCLCKSNYKAGIIKLSFSVVAYIIFCVTVKLTSNWYESSLSFIVGAIWALKKERIDSELDVFPKYIYTAISAVFVFAGTFILGNSSILPNGFRIPFKMISAVSFVVCVLLTAMRVRVNFKVLAFGGKYYFEIYFMQGFVVLLFNEVITVSSSIFKYIVCFVCVFFVAIIAKPVVNAINNKCRSI